jgi:nicotinate-nucleotide adenylyltransferase
LKIGIFGGTFDPPHKGHKHAIELVVKHVSLDLLYVMVANDPWIKSQFKEVTPAQKRLEMAKLAFSGTEKVIVSDLEIKRGGKSYTIDTVKEILRMYPDADLYLLIGSDLLLELPKWKNYQELVSLVGLIVLVRDVNDDRLLKVLEFKDVRIVKIDELGEISSTFIRQKIACGLSVNDLIDPRVMAYIQANKLYLN